MWYKCTDHKPDYQKWLRDDKFFQGQIAFNTTQPPTQNYISSSIFPSATVTGSGRCDTICRLPCSLQPLNSEHSKPKTWLSSDHAWDMAKKEVEQRKERLRLEEQEIVEKAIRKQERDQSEAVRIARTKLLDKEVTKDWKFQVLQKQRLKTDSAYEEFLKGQEENNLIREDLENMKLQEHQTLQRSIHKRIEEEILHEKRKQEEKLKLEKRHLEENEENFKIKQKTAEEKEQESRNRKLFMSLHDQKLLEQINENKSRKEKNLAEKKEKEWLERNRLRGLLEAEKQEMNVKKTLRRADEDNFKDAKVQFGNVMREDSKNNNFSFLDEGWKIEKEKITDANNHQANRKQLYKDCANFNKNLMKEQSDNIVKEQNSKQTEIRDRLSWESQYKKDLDMMKLEKKDKQDTYFNQINNQLAQNRQFKTSRDNYDNDHLQHIFKHRQYLKEIDLRESQNPIDNVNPLQY